MIDRSIGLFGLALAIVFFVLPLVPGGLSVPIWVVYAGVIVGTFILGLGTGLIVADKRRNSGNPPSLAIAEMPSPAIRFTMEGANIFEPDGVPYVLTGIAINAKVWNVGAPSTVTDWILFITVSKKKPQLAQATVIPEFLRVGGTTHSVVIRSSESLMRQTSLTPVSRRPINGVLLFYAKLSKAEILHSSTILELSAKDEFGQEEKVSKVMGDWLQL